MASEGRSVISLWVLVGAINSHMTGSPKYSAMRLIIKKRNM